jgi:hypothetical protein
VIESATYNDSGGVFWQGRYTLPLAVGVPILAAVTLTSTERGRQLATSGLLLGIGVVIGLAHVLAFAQNLRRNTVGYDGAFQFWEHPNWVPPLSPLLLTIAYVVAIGAFMTWLLGAASASEERAPVRPRAGGERAVPTELDAVGAPQEV